MNTFLNQVRSQKQKEVLLRKEKYSLASLQKQVSVFPPTRPFGDSLCRKSTSSPLCIIPELKQKAPGHENVNHLDPQEILPQYEQGGASAVSVLTDSQWFGGSLEMLQQVFTLTKLPLLQKEFVIDPYQIWESRLLGASAILLLAYYFTKIELQEMMQCCIDTGITPVVECSLEEEISTVVSVNPDIILLNNRPIAAIPANPTQTYSQGNYTVSLQWWNEHPELQEWKQQAGKKMISASCIDHPSQIQVIAKYPFDAVLIGNAVMKAPNRSIFLQSLVA